MTALDCGRCGTPLFLTESKRDGFCDDHRGNTPAVGDPDYHECADEAYQMAAMPGECTCSSSDA